MSEGLKINSSPFLKNNAPLTALEEQGNENPLVYGLSQTPPSQQGSPSFAGPNSTQAGLSMNNSPAYQSLQQQGIAATAPMSDTSISKPQTSGNMAGGMVGAIFDMVNQVIGGVSTIGQLLGIDYKSKEQKRQYNQSQAESTRRFDKTFYENIRQFNLEYGLKEFATRKGLKLQEAQMMWDQQMGEKTYGLNRATAMSNLRGAEINQKKSTYDFEKQLKKDKGVAKFSKLFTRSLMKSLSNKKKKKE